MEGQANFSGLEAEKRIEAVSKPLFGSARQRPYVEDSLPVCEPGPGQRPNPLFRLAEGHPLKACPPHKEFAFESPVG
jgi:hypothetical protein